MHSINHKIIIFALVPAALAVMGIFWKNYDTDRIKNLDYQTESKVLRQFNNKIAGDIFADAKRIFVGKYMFLIDEYLVDSTTYEITGQSNQYWLLSGHLHKLTFVGVPSLHTDKTATPSRLITIYDGHISGGALPFLSLAFFGILTTLALLLKKESLPSIFDENVNTPIEVNNQ